MTISVRKKLRFSETRWELECQQLFINVLLWSKAITWTLLTIIVNNYRHAYIMVKSKMNIEHSLDHKSDLIVPCCMGLQKCHVFGCDMWCQCQCWHLTWHCKTSPARCHLLPPAALTLNISMSDTSQKCDNWTSRWWSPQSCCCTQSLLELQTKIPNDYTKISQSWRRLLLGPSLGWKHLLALSHLRHY